MHLVRLALALIATIVAVAFAQPAALNASAPSFPAPSNSSLEGVCLVPYNAIDPWWYNSRQDGPYRCNGLNTQSWAMLNAYRSGGTENVHWKYTKDADDPYCMSNWEYYFEDGSTFISTIKRTTGLNSDGRLWCALPVYRSGGALGYQWDWCNCI